jgi:ATP-binding cassette subfamily B protein
VVPFAAVAEPARVLLVAGPADEGRAWTVTVIKLIARFFDPDAGGVRLGGVDVRELRTEDLMSLISVVFQDV